jgi:N-acetyl-alpha-D-muramate 1-phosphate uridylyltransferase
VTLCAIVLAAGEGRRLRPLTGLRPKPLCPVDNVPLLDRVLDRLATAGLAGPDRVAVNACHLADQIAAHVAGRAYVSVEAPPPLGTAGGVARLRDWIAGRDVLVCNADGYLSPGDTALHLLLDTGDGLRLLVVPDAGRGDFGERANQHSGERANRSGRHGGAPRRTLRFAGMSVLPWAAVAGLRPEPSELSIEVWRPAEAAGKLALVRFGGTFHDCGTPADYLAANLHASGGASVVGAGATVEGRLTRSVVWPGATVQAGEHLVDAVRAARPDGSPLTVPAAASMGA